jgi:tetratricopeptide (TPR) repeat protein
MRRLSLLSLLSAVVAAVLAAQAVPSHAGLGASPEAGSLLGSYLAGRVARAQNDTRAAAMFYRQALAQDPGNNLLIEQAFLMETSEGEWSRAEALARELVASQPNHRTAHALLGLADFKAQRYAAADEHFKAVSGNPIGELTSALARAWVAQAEGKTAEALALLEAPKLPDWAQFYLRYHRALIADVAGRRAEARAAYERIPANDQRTLRITLAYTRHAANAGDAKLAQRILKAHFDKAKADGHPEAKALQDQIDAGAEVTLLVGTPTEGLAEAFYGLGEALTGEGGVSVGAVYLQFALYLRPDFPFALATLANAYETTKRYQAAIDAYDRIPNDTALQVSVEIRKALNLNQLERVEEAKDLLEGTAQRNPADVRPLDALGGIMRGHKRYAEAVEYYSRAIALIDKPEQKHWSFFYSRGTCYERVTQLSRLLMDRSGQEPEARDGADREGRAPEAR